MDVAINLPPSFPVSSYPTEKEDASPGSPRRPLVLDGAADGDAQLADLVAQAAARDAEHLRRLQLVAAGVLQDLRHQHPLQAPQRLGVEVLRTGGELLVDELGQRQAVLGRGCGRAVALRQG